MQKLFVIKIGGNVIDDEEATKSFLQKFVMVPGKKILVHGGGKVATQIAERLGLKAQLIDGRRITDKAMLEVVTMVYGGLVNKNLVAGMQAIKTNAIGLTGADANCILAKKREVGEIDYGYAGDILEVNSTQIDAFLAGNLIPVFAPLTYDAQGNLLNTNADTMAATLAWTLSQLYEVHLVYCFEKKGVLSDPDNDESVMFKLFYKDYLQLKEASIISKGMIPKLDNAFLSLQKGVRNVIICHANELEKVTSPVSAYGTTLYP